MRRVLIAGCGDEGQQWADQGWKVVRLDIDPRSNPDIVGNMCDLGEIGEFDAIACNNALEHLYPHEVSKALREFRRVLKPGGHAIFQVPDLEDAKPTEDIIPEIGMSGLHLMYGDSALIEQYPHMAHHSGFIADTLRRVLEDAGFTAIVRRIPCYQLMGVGINERRD